VAGAEMNINHTSISNQERGFTLIELLIVVGIIGIIAAIAIPSLMFAIEKARQSATMNNMATLGRRIQQYVIDYPKIGCPKVGNDIDQLQAIMLLYGIDDDQSMFQDSWGNKLLIDASATMMDHRFTLTSLGADGQVGPNPVTPGVIKRFAEDLIWVDNKFVQRPEGKQDY
jgi:type II secretion system protein G